jgi:hypothetical protein
MVTSRTSWRASCSTPTGIGGRQVAETAPQELLRRLVAALHERECGLQPREIAAALDELVDHLAAPGIAELQEGLTERQTTWGSCPSASRRAWRRPSRAP